MIYTGIYPKLPLTAVIHLPLFTCFNENKYSPIIMHLWNTSIHLHNYMYTFMFMDDTDMYIRG